ncbi:MAG: DMT family transporter [Chloroflexota bacterium]|nr:MAG: DMT family transporter [Chloroflexota bacterium]
MTPGVVLSMLYCGAAFGGSFLFMRVAAPDLPPPVVAFLRIGIAALALLLVSRGPALRALRQDWRKFAFLGVFMTGGPFLLFAAAEQTITAGLGAVLNATTPMWTVLIVFFWLKQPLTAARVAAIVIGFAGVGVIVGTEGLRIGPDAWVGVALATLAASLYGIGLTFARRNLSGHEPLELAFGQLAAGAVLLAPFALLTSGSAHPTPASAAAIFGIAIVSTAIAWPLLFSLNRQVGPLATSTIPFLNPIFGVLWGALFLHEAVTPSLLGGGLLVFIALALILDVRPRRAVPAPPA